MEITRYDYCAGDVRMYCHMLWKQAVQKAESKTGLQASYWRREARRRRRAYNEAKALTFAAAYGGTYTTRLNRREP